MKTYFLNDVLRRHHIGPLTQAELFDTILINANGKTDIRDALRQFGVTVVQVSNIYELAEGYRDHALKQEEVKS